MEIVGVTVPDGSCCTALVAVLVLTLLIWRRYMSPLSDIPGPFVASWTRLWHMHRILIGDQNLELARLHQEHGHFVRISYDEVSVSHPDGIKKLLLASLHKAPWYKVLALPDYRFQTPMSTTDPKEKTRRSKFLVPAYALSNVIQQEPAVSRTVEGLLDWMDKYAESKQPMHLDKFFTYAAFDVVGEIIFSTPFGFLQHGIDISNAISNSLALNSYIAAAGYFRWIHTALLANPLVTWLAVLPMGHLFNTTMTAVSERIENDQDARFDVLAHWFRLHRLDPEGLTLRDIHAQAVGAVGAGSDTVSSGLQSFVYHMIRHPTAWQRARAEIDAARRERGACVDRVVSFHDAQQLPYLQVCIKEALRVFSPVPMGLPRVAPKGGLTIGSHTFPQGTILSVNPWVIHHSKELWGPDADVFDPDRWLRGDSATLDRYWIPFGVGYASCPGQNIAKLELAKITATLVRDYDICMVDEGQEWSWKAYFTVVPNNWPVFIKRRLGQREA